jgi:hypothetical protein
LFNEGVKITFLAGGLNLCYTFFEIGTENSLRDKLNEEGWWQVSGKEKMHVTLCNPINGKYFTNV